MSSQNFRTVDTSIDLAFNVAKDGYVLKKKWHPEASSDAIAAAIGHTLVLNQADAVHHIAPKAEAGPNSYSGIYGLGRFPFHTDLAHCRMPPHYLMLRCVRGYASVCTDLIDGFALVERIGRSIMSRALVKPRRPLNGSTPLYSLYQPPTSSRDAMLRWDQVFILPASPAGEQGVTRVVEEIGSFPHIPISLVSPGDTVLIDNWRMLHSRSAISADQVDRVIQRAYFGELH